MTLAIIKLLSNDVAVYCTTTCFKVHVLFYTGVISRNFPHIPYGIETTLQITCLISKDHGDCYPLHAENGVSLDLWSSSMCKQGLCPIFKPRVTSAFILM